MSEGTIVQPAMKPLLCAASVVRNFLNVEVGSWPPKAIDPSKPMQWQDRRPIKPQPNIWQEAWAVHFGLAGKEGLCFWVPEGVSRRVLGTENFIEYFCPIKVGDVLYVRESFRIYAEGIDFKCGGSLGALPIEATTRWIPETETFRPSIHMPKWASRIHLEVMRVRVERACDISDGDAIAEGMIQGGEQFTTPKEQFASLWQSLYGPDAWEKWCWVYDLKRVK